MTLLGVVTSFCTKLKVWTVSNCVQQLPLTCNRVFKRTQHVTYYNVECCWPTILRPFTQGLMIHWFVWGLLKTRALESESHGQTNRPHRYKCGKVSGLISDTCDTVDTCFDCEQRVEIVWGLSQSKRRGWKLNGFGETIAVQQHIATSNLCQLIAVSFKLSLMKHVCLNLLFIGAADSIKQRFLFSFSWQLYILPFLMHIYMYSL